MSELTDDTGLIGDEEPEHGVDGVAAAAANPRSILDDDQRAELTERFGDDLRFDEPMRRHTTARMGGPADVFAMPSSAERLISLIRWCAGAGAGMPVTVMGGGSNLLVRDAGIRGVVLNTGRLRAIALVDGNAIEVESGCSTGKVLSLATKNDLGGVEFLGGVPGSIGGGLIMNAGTYLGELKDVTAWVESVRLSDGAIVRRDNAACGFRYRDSDLPPTEIVVRARLELKPRPRAEIEAEVKALRKRRHDREPKKVASNGSTFKNPPGDFAGRLIEAAGCKGWQVGDALCSPVHANWLVNVGNATCTDMLTLIERVRARVVEVHGVTLQLEVKILGEDVPGEMS
ncbi:MAG TPA: UDP-N-acetylmuramate dehydrogenase [Kofleriaceae bacterium]|nr:UDP-N-acetylmuramate dehydrogenase [Kofleriaceae bacterium]